MALTVRLIPFIAKSSQNCERRSCTMYCHDTTVRGHRIGVIDWVISNLRPNRSLDKKNRATSRPKVLMWLQYHSSVDVLGSLFHINRPLLMFANYDKDHRMAMHEFKESQSYCALNNGILTHQRGIERGMARNMNQPTGLIPLISPRTIEDINSFTTNAHPSWMTYRSTPRTFLKKVFHSHHENLPPIFQVVEERLSQNAVSS